MRFLRTRQLLRCSVTRTVKIQSDLATSGTTLVRLVCLDSSPILLLRPEAVVRISPPGAEMLVQAFIPRATMPDPLRCAIRHSTVLEEVMQSARPLLVGLRSHFLFNFFITVD